MSNVDLYWKQSINGKMIGGKKGEGSAHLNNKKILKALHLPDVLCNLFLLMQRILNF